MYAILNPAMHLWVIQHITMEDITHNYSITMTQILCERPKTVFLDLLSTQHQKLQALLLNIRRTD
jgi:hypothetical protein